MCSRMRGSIAVALDEAKIANIRQMWRAHKIRHKPIRSATTTKSCRRRPAYPVGNRLVHWAILIAR